MIFPQQVGNKKIVLLILLLTGKCSGTTLKEKNRVKMKRIGVTNVVQRVSSSGDEFPDELWNNFDSYNDSDQSDRDLHSEM